MTRGLRNYGGDLMTGHIFMLIYTNKLLVFMDIYVFKHFKFKINY